MFSRLEREIACRVDMLRRVCRWDEVDVNDPQDVRRRQVRQNYPNQYRDWDAADYLNGRLRNLVAALVYGYNGRFQLSPVLYKGNDKYTRWVKFREGVPVGPVKWKPIS